MVTWACHRALTGSSQCLSTSNYLTEMAQHKGRWGIEGGVKDLLDGSEELMLTNYCTLGKVNWWRAEPVCTLWLSLLFSPLLSILHFWGSLVVWNTYARKRLGNEVLNLSALDFPSNASLNGTARIPFHLTALWKLSWLQNLQFIMGHCYFIIWSIYPFLRGYGFNFYLESFPAHWPCRLPNANPYCCREMAT